MSDLLPVSFPALMAIAQRSAAISQPCNCQNNSLAGWESMPLSLPEGQLREVGPLNLLDDMEASYEEFHPARTDYWSADAPIAVNYFPYNRCAVWECCLCGRAFLRYTEGGGYFVDRRIRALNPALIVDVPV